MKFLKGGGYCEYGQYLVRCQVTIDGNSHSGVLCASNSKEAAGLVSDLYPAELEAGVRCR